MASLIADEHLRPFVKWKVELDEVTNQLLEELLWQRLLLGVFTAAPLWLAALGNCCIRCISFFCKLEGWGERGERLRPRLCKAFCDHVRRNVVQVYNVIRKPLSIFTCEIGWGHQPATLRSRSSRGD